MNSLGDQNYPCGEVDQGQPKFIIYVNYDVSLGDQNYPCDKVGQGKPKFIIYVNYEGPESPILHTKFHCNQSTGSREDDF